jgi:hypothetical protein
MLKEYNQKQLWEYYEKLPYDIKEKFFSPEIADIIWNICQKNNIPLNDISKVSKLVGAVVLKILPIDQLQIEIENELKINSSSAQKIFKEFNSLIFSSIQKIDIKNKKSSISPDKKEVLNEGNQVKLKSRQNKDTYREKLE